MNAEHSVLSSEPTFVDHFDLKLLHKIELEHTPTSLPTSPTRAFLFDDPREFSRFLFWSVFTGVFVPTPDGNDNFEKHVLLKIHYTEKREKYLLDLSQIESDDFENPLSRDYQLSFEMETKNQVKIDIVRISFLRDILQKHSSILFRVLYYWSLENNAIGYRQGGFRRHERTSWLYFKCCSD